MLFNEKLNMNRRPRRYELLDRVSQNEAKESDHLKAGKSLFIFFTPLPVRSSHPHVPGCRTCVAVGFKCIPRFSETNKALNAVR